MFACRTAVIVIWDVPTASFTLTWDIKKHRFRYASEISPI